MGWLCSECGVENRFRETHCRACLSRGSLSSRIAGLGITFYEHCSANHLGSFAETMLEKVEHGVRRANRAVSIGMVIAVLCGIGLMLFLSKGIVQRMRIDQMGERIVQRAETAAETLMFRVQQFTEFGGIWEDAVQQASSSVESRVESVGAAVGYAAERMEYGAEEVGGRLSELGLRLDGAGENLTKLGEMTLEKLPRIDICFVMWLHERLYDLYSWIRTEDIGWLGGLAEWTQTARSGLQRLANMLWELRS